MRWIVLIASFGALVFLSFLIFLWTWRCELIARAFELSLEKAPTHIESVTACSLHSFDLSHVSLRFPEDKTLHIEKILLEIRFSDLFSWMCIPVRSPLVVEKATLAFQNWQPIQKFSSTNCDLLIQEMEVITPEGRKLLLGEEKGSIGSILNDVLATIETENPSHP